MNAPAANLGTKVLQCLSGSLVVVGELRQRLERFADNSSPEQRRALGTDIAFFILTTGGPGADRLLGEVDAATSSAFFVAPRDDVVGIESSESVVEARARASGLALRLGFTPMERTRIATVVSELARNIHLYAGHGAVELMVVDRPSRGLAIVARDNGPGIADVSAVLTDEYRSKKGLGVGLKGVRRVAHDFKIESVPGHGTRAEARFFLARRLAR